MFWAETESAQSTLMKAVIGLLPARSGTLRFKGDEITREGAHRRARRGIGYVPQGREIFPHIGVLDNLRMGQFVNQGPGTSTSSRSMIGFHFSGTEAASAAVPCPASRKCLRSPGLW